MYGTENGPNLERFVVAPELCQDQGFFPEVQGSFFFIFFL